MANSPFNNPTKKPLALARQQAELVGILNAENLSNSKLIQRLRRINVTDLVNSGDGLRVCECISLDYIQSKKKKINKMVFSHVNSLIAVLVD